MMVWLRKPLLVIGLLALLIGTAIWLFRMEDARGAGAITGYLIAGGLISLCLFWGMSRRPKTPPTTHGSADWAGDRDAKSWSTASEEKAANGGATIHLGELLSKPEQPFLYTTDKHVLVIASAGSGKGTDLIIPNLLRYEGSVFAHDPKGELARATARHRQTFGTVHCLDPFGESSFPTGRLNPLAPMGRPENRHKVATMAAALAAALIPPDNGHNRFFTDSARQLLEALIAYVATDEKWSDVADLVLVRNLLTTDLKAELELMKKTVTGPASIRSNAGRMLQLGEREFGAILANAVNDTAFLDDPHIQNVVSANPGNQIDLSEWRSGVMTLYVCIPAPLARAFDRWLRLMVTCALDEMTRQHAPPPRPVMFMLDELAVLGRMPPIEDAIGLARGYGVQIWSIFQDIGQMQEIYNKRASSFFGNAGVQVFFGTQDYETAKVISDIMGQQTTETEITKGGEVSDIRQSARALQTADEVMRQPAGTMIVKIAGEQPLMLARRPYYRASYLRDLWDDPRRRVN